MGSAARQTQSPQGHFLSVATVCGLRRMVTIKFLPYGYESKSVSGPNIIYPDLHALSEILDMHGESTSVEELYNLYGELGLQRRILRRCLAKTHCSE